MKALLHNIEKFAGAKPDAIAVRSESRTLSYAELWQDINDLARLLDERAISSLAIYLENGIEWIVIDLACQMANVSVVPLPWFFSPAQRQHACDDGAVEWIVASEELAPDVAACGKARLFYRDSVIHAIEGRKANASNDNDKPRGHKISYTSGTTGNPKGIALSPELIEQTTRSICQLLAPLEIQQHLSVLPYSTLLENIAGIYVPLMLGKTVCAEPATQIGLSADLKLDAMQFSRCIARTRAGSLVITPGLLDVLCQLTEKGMIDPGQFQFVAVGGARVAVELVQRAQDLGIPAFEGYGLTEFASVALLNTPWQQRAGSAGKPLPGVEVCLAADGEILLSRQIDQSAPGMTQYRVATGDLGHIDDDGFVYVSGRKSNLIILGTGRNVSPEWIETELNNSPLIQQSLVYGEARPHLSALIHATTDVSDDDLWNELQRINRQLPAYARIVEWTRLGRPFSTADGTLTPNGRLRRRVILDQLESLTGTNQHSTSHSFSTQEHAAC
jgi:long-chain acyl-CoA synthetase